ncbi:MAG: carboxypeptidase regulatory-like domain-containing protein, partial [Bacteroidales bacterium]|nr:carboxypeptidase regulatory-like domain-containing protein [Bacteroidales bacterium]
MKKTKLLFFTVLMLFAFAASAQYPVLTWRFANETIIPGTPDSLRFDVELKCDIDSTHHSSTQIYFNYNTTAFGENIATNNKIRFEKLELLDGYLGTLPYYNVVNYADNEPGRFAIVFEYGIPNLLYMNMVRTDYKGFMQFTIAIQDTNQVAGIQLVAETLSGVPIMDGGQYYLHAVTLQETKYGVPPDYAGIYANDLLNFWLTPIGEIAGTVTESGSGTPIEGATVTAGTFIDVTLADGTYSMTVPVDTYDVTADAQCYEPLTQTGIVVNTGVTTTVDFALVPDPYGIITGTVTELGTGSPIAGVLVSTNTGGYSATTIADGTYEILDVDPGTYDLTATHVDYYDQIATGVVVVCEETVTVDFVLTPLPTVGIIDGTVTEVITGTPIVGAVVTTTPGGYTGTTITGGTYEILDVPEGTYDLTCVAPNYFDETATGIAVISGQTTTQDFEMTPVTPPSNLAASVNGNDVTLTWTAPGGGPTGTILVVDRDGSFQGDYTNCWPAVQAALDANGYTYTYYDVEDMAGDGPDLATMMGHDIIIWFSGEAWGYYGDDCMTPNDENNVGQFLDAGGALFFSGQDYLWASYQSAGNFSAGQFPYDYLGLRTVVQDSWSIQSPATASCEGATGSIAAGYTFQVADIFTTKEGLYIDQITDHVGQDMFNVTSPAPAGVGAIQYAPATFKSIFTAISFSAITDAGIQADLMAEIINYFSTAKDGKALLGYNV